MSKIAKALKEDFSNSKEGAPIGNQNARKPAAQVLNPVTIRLLDSQLDKLKAVAKSQDLTYNELIRRWIDRL